MRLFKRLITSENTPGPLTSSVDVRSKQRATGQVEVRRFQGAYKCGCHAHPLDEPMECPVHGEPKHYVVESVEIMKITVMEESHGV